MQNPDYTSMPTSELEALAKNMVQQENEIMKELLRRGWGRHLPDMLEHADMQRTEDDF